MCCQNNGHYSLKYESWKHIFLIQQVSFIPSLGFNGLYLKSYMNTATSFLPKYHISRTKLSDSNLLHGSFMQTWLINFDRFKIHLFGTGFKMFGVNMNVKAKLKIWMFSRFCLLCWLISNQSAWGMLDNISCEMYTPGKHNFQEPGKIETHNSDFADKQKLTNWDEWPGLANIFVLDKFQVGNSFYKFFPAAVPLLVRVMCVLQQKQIR